LRTCARASIVLFVLLVIVTARAAVAEDYTRIDLSDTSIGFTPGDVYGPWIIQDARIVFVQPGQGSVNFEFAHQADGDPIYPTHGEYFVGGITRDLTRRLYVWGQLGYGTSNPYARTDVHIEAEYKTTPDLKLVLGSSEDFIDYYSGTNLKLFQIGPSYYYNTGVVQVRYLCSANSGAQTKGGLLASWDITPNIRTKFSMTGLFGPQQYIVSIPGIPNALANFVGQTYTAQVQQQIGQPDRNGLRWGITAGGLLSHTTLVSGSPLYTQRGATLGLWTTFPQ
jgi:YaiO family outer membrane protein